MWRDVLVGRGRAEASKEGMRFARKDWDAVMMMVSLWLVVVDDDNSGGLGFTWQYSCAKFNL